MRYSDKPITRAAQDLLGRAPFSLSLARAIDNLSVAKEGFVIAILGEWGSGKTSVINLVCRYLLHLEMERASRSPSGFETAASPRTLTELEEMADIFEAVRPHVEDFFTANQHIVRAAKDARWHELRRWVPDDGTADTADRYWRLRDQVEARRHTVVVHFSPWLISGRAEITSALLSDLGRALGARLGEDVRQAFGKIIKRLMEFAPLAGAGLDIAAHGIGAGALFRAGGDWSHKIAARMTIGPSLDDLKAELAQVLLGLDQQQVLVVVDDLDRLTPLEALEMVSMVKSLADLPNVIYLLSYEEKRLSQLISEATKIDGYSFLEKIVQYPVHLPRIDNDDLSRLLNDDLNALLPAPSEDDTLRLHYLWREVLQVYVSTPRDVRRLANSFTVAAAALKDFTDLIDLLILDSFRLFEPDLYQYVRRNIGDLTDAVSLRTDGESSAAAMEEIVKNASEPRAARNGLALLFPKAAQTLKTALYSGVEDGNLRRKARRISMSDFAPAYFGLDPQKATWGRSELDRILNRDDAEAAFQMVEERLGFAAEADRPGLRRLFLDELQITFEASRSITNDWLRALLNVSPTYIAAEIEVTSFLDVADNSNKLWRIVVRALEKLEVYDRAALIASVLPELSDLSVICVVFRAVVADRRREGAVTDRISAASLGDKAEVVREQLLARVRDMAATGAIWRQAIPRDIVLFWWGSTLDKEVWDFTSAAARVADVRLSLLKIPVHPVYSSAGNYETVAPTWSEILDLDVLVGCAQKILAEELPEEDKRIAQRFLTAMQNRGRR
jgi:hypothetical protein